MEFCTVGPDSGDCAEVVRVWKNGNVAWRNNNNNNRCNGTKDYFRLPTGAYASIEDGARAYRALCITAMPPHPLAGAGAAAQRAAASHTPPARAHTEPGLPHTSTPADDHLAPGARAPSLAGQQRAGREWLRPPETPGWLHDRVRSVVRAAARLGESNPGGSWWAWLRAAPAAGPPRLPDA